MKDEVFYTEANYPRVLKGRGLYRKYAVRSNAKAILKYGKIKSGTVFLEVGCDEGTLLKTLEKSGATGYGIDINSDSVRAAGHPRIKVAPADVISFQDGFFDVCVSSHTIEHLEQPEQFLKEVNRILKPKGVLILLYPWELFHGMTLVLDMLLNGRMPRPALLKRIHRHIFTPAKLSALAGQNNFTPVASRVHWGLRFLPQFISVFEKR